MTSFQSRQPLLFEAHPPACDGSRTGLHAALDLAIALACGQRQEEPRSEHVARRQGPRLCPTFQILFLFWSNGEQVSIIRHVLQTVETCFRYHWDTILVRRKMLFTG